MADSRALPPVEELRLTPKIGDIISSHHILSTKFTILTPHFKCVILILKIRRCCMKNALVLVLSLGILLSACGMAVAEDKAAAKKSLAATTAPVKPRLPRANFGMISGSLVKIDNSDPAKAKIEVKDAADGKVKTIEVTQFTNIVRGIDLSELKSGEEVKIMARKSDDKDIAMNIMCGKMNRPAMAARPAIKAPLKGQPAPLAEKKK